LASQIAAVRLPDDDRNHLWVLNKSNFLRGWFIADSISAGSIVAGFDSSLLHHRTAESPGGRYPLFGGLPWSG
jgi:hypothetical protein